MKKITFLIIGMFVSGILFSQTIIFQDNFDSYTVGQGVASQSADWNTYGGGSTESLVSSQYAQSPSNSMNVINNDYMIYLFGNKQSGHYKLEFQMLLKNSNGAHLQVSHLSTQNTAFTLLFEDDNYIHFDNGTNTHSLMPFTHGQWMSIVMDFDLGNDTVIISIDGTVNGYQFSKSSSGSPSIQLGDIVFYGANSGNISNSDYFIDDFKYSDMSGAPVGCADTANIYEFTYDNKTYEVVREKKSWSNAAACAEERGGYLVEINGQSEQNAVYDAIINGAGVSSTYTVVNNGGGIAYVWIGATDKSTEGSWLWDGDDNAIGANFWTGQGDNGAGDGIAVGGAYTNWGGTSNGNANEPDDFGSGQDCGAIALAGWPAGTTILGIAGEWNDIISTSSVYYVIEYNNASGINSMDNYDKPILIYPNPANDIINIKMENSEQKVTSLSIRNQLGVTVHEQKSILSSDLMIDISKLAQGVYFINISFEKGAAVNRKIIIN